MINIPDFISSKNQINCNNVKNPISSKFMNDLILEDIIKQINPKIWRKLNHKLKKFYNEIKYDKPIELFKKNNVGRYWWYKNI